MKFLKEYHDLLYREIEDYFFLSKKWKSENISVQEKKILSKNLPNYIQEQDQSLFNWEKYIRLTNGAFKAKTFDIHKFEDDWFLVYYGNGSRFTPFKCDSLQGVINLVKDYS